ncbi:hypothetical protein SCP_0409140 [Sparassis crispa]|uniref:Uncharacterized protein n=1 Tax=Sparassis crispa TaxID=139825 RepID=A0A401GK45_9APHY|nr:hypothetical protein SCP_0409140 [Sparassis crispa]GBE82530.1 hypothetical protein SCP_0409140 [Sparassis crispa]
MNGAVSASDPIQEAMASSSHLILDSDPISLPLDSDEAMLSRSNSLLNADDSTPPRNSLRRSQAPRRDKGKGREKDVGVKVKEEPFAVTLAMSEVVPSNRLVSQKNSFF